jgi:hypothetical protein
MMLSSASLLAALLLAASSGPANPRGPAATRPTSRPAAGGTVDLSQLDGPERLRRTPVQRSPELTALVASALRHYAEGTTPSGPLETAIAKSMNGTRGGKGIARRILARIDALPAKQRAAAFGDEDDRGPVTAQTLGQATAAAGLVFGGIGIKPPDTLPAMGVTVPGTLELSLSGLAVTEIADADGSDELLAMTTLVRLDSAKSFVVDTIAAPGTGAITDLAAGDVDAIGRTVYSGPSTTVFVASAVFEIDGDDATIRQEYVAMVALAKALAEQLATPGDDTSTRLGRFAFALDYTIGLLALSHPTTWPTGVLQKSLVSVGGLWSSPAGSNGAVPWKLAHEHDLPSGHYTLYFDVPSPAITQPNVKVKIARVESLDAENGGDDMLVNVAIGNAKLEKVLATNKNVHNPNWTVQRKVNGPINVTITVKEFDEGPEFGFAAGGMGGVVPCGDPAGPPQYAPCPDSWDVLDIHPGPYEWLAVLSVDPTTGKITGAATGDVGDELTLTGTGAPRGKVKLVIAVE